MRTRMRLSSDEGFTLIELVAALAILVVVAMGVIGSMSFAASASQSTGIRNSAMALAQERIEAARNMPYDNVGVHYTTGGYGDPPGTIMSPAVVSSGDTTFTVFTQVTWARDPNPPYRAQYKKMAVTVQWSRPTTDQITLETGIFGKSNILTNGDLEVFVRDRDTNQPVANAQVIVDPTATGALPRTGWTNAVGSVFYGFIESGNVTMSVDAPGYVTDASQYATYTIQAQMLNQMILFVQRPSIIRVRAVSGSTPIVGASVTASSPKFGTRTLPTDADGYASFDESFVGTYTVSMSAVGYVDPPDQEATITAGGQTVNVNFVANPAAGVRVVVYDKVTNALISGATLTATNTLGQPAPGSPALTVGGEYTFQNMVEGTYAVWATRTGVSGTGPCYVTTGTTGIPVTYGSVPTRTLYMTPWGTMYIRIMKGTSARTGYNVAITGPGGYNQTKKTDGSGYIKIPYLMAGTYTIKKTTASTPSFTYVVSDGVIPATATDLTSSGW